jgi:hypothetical protein
MDAPTAALRIAAAMFWIMPLGFAVFAVPIAIDLLRGGELPTIFGFTAFGGGAFDRFSAPTFAGLLFAFALLCVLEAVAGAWLWDGRRSGALLGLALLPIGAIFWLGFALPLPPINAALRTVLVLLSWSSLRP